MEISTTAQTVIAGVLVFVLGQMLLKWIIEPIHQLKKTMADISHTFVRHAYIIHNAETLPSDLQNEVFEKLRQLSGQLYADMALIPLYPILCKLFGLPDKKKIYKSAKNLIAIANWMSSNNERKFDHIIKNIQAACDNLGLYIDPEDRISDENLSL
jgi:hypothetical protein